MCDAHQDVEGGVEAYNEEDGAWAENDDGTVLDLEWPPVFREMRFRWREVPEVVGIRGGRRGVIGWPPLPLRIEPGQRILCGATPARAATAVGHLCYVEDHSKPEFGPNLLWLGMEDDGRLALVAPHLSEWWETAYLTGREYLYVVFAVEEVTGRNW